MAIVKVDKRSYRKIAQENWGLTEEQMKGMHVHHRIPRSQGGTNDPSNLFVCSPSFHVYVWHHGQNLRALKSVAGGKKGGPIGGLAKPSAETKAKMSKAHKGKTLTPEHKQKIREAAFRRWANVA